MFALPLSDQFLTMKKSEHTLDHSPALQLVDTGEITITGESPAGLQSIRLQYRLSFGFPSDSHHSSVTIVPL